MILKLIITLTIVSCSLFGLDKHIFATYKISYGIIGEIGEATAEMDIEKNIYKIKVEAKATGLAKTLSRGRVERYESTGFVQDDKLIPDLFISSKKRADKEDIKRYLFKHDIKCVEVLSSKIKEDEKKDYKNSCDFYAPEDILTLFFNLTYYLGEAYSAPELVKLAAVGANSRTGTVDIHSLDMHKVEKENPFFKNSHALLSVRLNERIFASKNGEMIININQKGICDKALLKDVVLFGDIRGELTSLTIK